MDTRLPRVGDHPVAIMTINRLRARLSSVTVVLITGTPWPRSTHIPFGPEAGVTKHTEFYVNATELYTIPTAACRRRRGLRDRGELAALEDALRAVLGLQP